MKNDRIRRLVGCIALAMACIMIGSAITLTTNPYASAEEQTVTVVHTSPFTQAIASVRDSVVGVSNYQEVTYGSYGNGYGNFYFGFGYGYGYGDGRGNQEPETREELASTGSGVVIGEGFVLTNYHVVEDASSLKVTVTNDAGETEEYAASLVAYDENLDAAIIYAPKCTLPAVSLGDSDTLMVGDWAICIGNPLGFTKTETTGIVSALNRAVESDTYDRYGRKETISNAMIQVDAAINSGNSGGGMFSVTGELMGIPTLKYSGSYYSGSTVEGIGMCIPINAVKPLIEDVLSGRIVAEPPIEDAEETASSGTDLTGKPRMGISIRDFTTSFYAYTGGLLPKGAYVAEVEPGSPAEAAGMQAGDIIVEINDVIVTSTSELQTEVAKHTTGDVLKIKVFRAEGMANLDTLTTIPEDGEYIDLEVTLAMIDTVKQ
ncbi:MAG: trypsin-like peptidase domain-containing protein [Clostridia bacterium]|nr:trypsin-like peptidase domain-containing protein [Clostridia bacterium]